MAKRKTAGRKTSTLATLLGFFDLADATIEQVTGKSIPAWLKELQGQNEGDRLKATADPYAVLGLPQDASLEEVKARYKQLSKIFHPDKEGGYTEAMKRLNETYQQIMKEKGSK